MNSSEGKIYDQLWTADWEFATCFAPSIRTRYRILTKTYAPLWATWQCA